MLVGLGLPQLWVRKQGNTLIVYEPKTLNPKTQNPKHKTLNPKPQTRNPKPLKPLTPQNFVDFLHRF